MEEAFLSDCNEMRALIKEYGGVDSYTTTQAISLFKLVYKAVADLGYDIENEAEFHKGVEKLFNIEVIGMRDFSHGKYVFAPNHVSEFDGLIFGTLVANMLVVAKNEWISNPNLNAFTQKLFSIVGIDRNDKMSGMNALRECISYLESGDDRAVTVFVQQTIVDIEITTAEDVASGAYYIAEKGGAQLIPVYQEQVSLDHPTRIVFGDPIVCNRNDFGEEWLKREYALRDSISSPAARPPILCEKHSKPISQREF